MFAPTTGIAGMCLGGTHNIITLNDKYCLEFDGVDDMLITGPEFDSGLTFADVFKAPEFSVSWWMKVTGVPATSEKIWGVTFDANNYFSCSYNAIDEIQYFIGVDGTFRDSTTYVKIYDDFGNSWVHCVLVANASHTKLWCNGQYAGGTAPIDTTQFDIDETVPIGIGGQLKGDWFTEYKSGGIGQGYFDGKISNISFFNKSLSEEEREALDDGADPKHISGLLGSYGMGDGSRDLIIETIAEDNMDADNTGDWYAKSLFWTSVDASVTYDAVEECYRISSNEGAVMFVTGNVQFIDGRPYRVFMDYKNGSATDVYWLLIWYDAITKNSGRFGSVTTGSSWQTTPNSAVFTPNVSTIYGYVGLYIPSSLAGDDICVRFMRCDAVESVEDRSTSHNHASAFNMEEADIVEDAP